MTFRVVLLAGMALVQLVFLPGCAGRDSYVPSKAPVITLQPQDQSILEGQTATFTADCHTDFFITNVQWLVNGENKALYYGQGSYTTPPTTLANDGDRVQYVISNAYGSASSRVALLHVIPAPLQVKYPEPRDAAAAVQAPAHPGTGSR